MNSPYNFNQLVLKSKRLLFVRKVLKWHQLWQAILRNNWKVDLLLLGDKKHGNKYLNILSNSV